MICRLPTPLSRLLKPLLAVLCLASAIEVSLAVDGETLAVDRPGWYMGRQIAPTMSADGGAAWLLRKSREREEQPKLLLKSLQIKPGDVVCDFGCGNGYYTIPLAHRVGPRGKVIALDIQQEMLDLLKMRVEPRGIKNVELVLARNNEPGIQPNSIDLLLMVDVYHELEDPHRILAIVRTGLKRDGSLVLVEYREEDPNVPIRRLHKMNQRQILKELRANDFKFVRQFDDLPWQHVMFFARRDSALKEAKLDLWKHPGQAASDAVLIPPVVSSQKSGSGAEESGDVSSAGR